MTQAMDKKPLSSSKTKRNASSKSTYKPQKPWIETPLIESAILSKKAGWYLPSTPSMHQSHKRETDPKGGLIVEYSLNSRIFNQVDRSSHGILPLFSCPSLSDDKRTVSTDSQTEQWPPSSYITSITPPTQKRNYTSSSIQAAMPVSLQSVLHAPCLIPAQSLFR